jgi:hypothetical protein
MKPILKLATFILLIGVLFHLSCKKETSCESCNDKNKPPIAHAGSDQVITLPTDSVSPDGNASSDPDGTISEWLWTKISGPASFAITNTSTAKTIVKNLAAGIYQFELKVKDNGELFAKDTIQIIVNDSIQPNQPPTVDTLTGQEIIYNGNWSCNDLCRDGDVYWDSSPWGHNSYSDPNIPLKVSIRLDTSSVWIDVHNINSTLPPINQFYWQIDRGFLWVFAYEGRLIGTSVTIKINIL